MTSLAPTFIDDLRLETHHRGHCLLVRCLTEPLLLVAGTAIVEDERGLAVKLQVHIREHEGYFPLKRIVDVGKIILIKEPYYHIAMDDNASCLRVDHLSDIVGLSEGHDMVPEVWRSERMDTFHSANHWKALGNAAINTKQFWDAIAFYSHGLRSTSTEDMSQTLRRNRSLAYLKTKQFDAALSDTGYPSFGAEPSDKALFRASEALYNLSRFSESHEVLMVLLQSFPTHEAGLKALKRVKERCTEQLTGAYDFVKLLERADHVDSPFQDVATYVGPMEVRQTTSKGRGVFATRAVKAGELLLCEKAFCYASGKNGLGVYYQYDRDRGVVGVQGGLLKDIVQKLYRSPSRAPELLDLYHGSYQATSTRFVDSQPIVDTFLVQEIVNFNSFDCPNSPTAWLLTQALPSFGIEVPYHSCGVWVKASYINHSCVNNAHRTFLGDVMVVRATRDIEADEEILFTYDPRSEFTLESMEEKRKFWGFTCNCAIHQDENATKAADLEERDKLEDAVVQALKSKKSPRMMKCLEHLIDSLRNTYKAPFSDAPQQTLFAYQFTFARHCSLQGKKNKCLKMLANAFTSLGFVFTGMDTSATAFAINKWGIASCSLLVAFTLLKHVFEVLGAPDKAAKTEEYQRVVVKIMVGDDGDFHATMENLAPEGTFN